jgi:hypothetical protein
MLCLIFLLFSSSLAEEKQKFTIIVRNQKPFSSCKSGFTGYEVDLIREAFTRSQWRYMEEYEFICEDEVQSDIKHHATIGRMIIDSTKVSKDYKYSVPTHTGAVGILLLQEEKKTASHLIAMFSFPVWLIIIAVALVYGVLIGISEVGQHEFGKKPIKAIVTGLWVPFSNYFLADSPHPKRPGGRVLQVLFIFFAFCMTALFIAACASDVLYNFATIDSPEKLFNKIVLTEPVYHKYVASYGAMRSKENYSDFEGYQPIYEKLKNKEIDAVVLERDVLEKVSDEECDMMILDRAFMSNPYSVEIEPGTHNDLLTVLNGGITYLEQEQQIESLRRTYFTSSDPCNDVRLSEIRPIGFIAFGVLWVFWGLSIMIAFFLRVFLKKGEYVRKRKIHEKKIKRLLCRPETKILLPTEKMIRWNDLEAFSRLSMLEKTMKKHYILQQRVTAAMKNLANRIEGTNRQF